MRKLKQLSLVSMSATKKVRDPRAQCVSRDHSVSNHGAAFGMHVPARGVLPSRFEGPIVGRKVGPFHVFPRVWALRLCEKVLPYAEIQAECDLADDAAVSWRLAALS